MSSTPTTNTAIDSTQNYHAMLKESITHFVTTYRTGTTSDFSSLQSIFFRFLQTMSDPPLEIILFYSALTFHSSSKSSILDFQEHPSKKMLLANDMFQLLVSCSRPCCGVKKVATLAPFLYQLCELVSEFTKNGLFVKKEIVGLVDGVVGYVSLCCGSDFGQEGDDLIVGFEDLVRVWTVDRTGESCEIGEVLNVFFPLLSNGVCEGVIKHCKIGCLGGVVMNEVFFLSLYLKFGLEGSREELQKDMEIWVGQTINGFRNYYFLDTLLRMLLEPTFPATTLLSLEDTVLLRKVLFDAVILVDFAFLNTGRWTQLPDNHLKDLALLWSLVADSAIRFAREICDHSRAISYITAFSESHLPNQLIKWAVTDHTCLVMEATSEPNINTPKALINWLIFLEDQGLKVFDDEMLNFHAKAAISNSTVDYELPEFKLDGKNPSDNILFKTRKGKDKVDENQEMADSFPADDFTGSLTVTDDGTRKRKNEVGNGETRVKLVKYYLHENCCGKKFLPVSDHNGLSTGSDDENPVHGPSSWSEVDNPVSDEDMEDMRW